MDFLTRMGRSLARAVGYAFAVLAILAAVLLTLARLALPYLESYRGALEGWASGQLGQPLRIGAVDARLLGLSPTLVLQDVALLDDSGTTPIARFAEARIGLQVAASLQLRRLVLSGLTVAGAELELVREADGRLRVHGWVPGTPTANGGGVGRWLREQRRITLKDCRVHWHDRAAGGPRVTLHALELELANDGERHRLHGTLLMPQEVGGQARLVAEISGDPTVLQGWEGRAYLAAHGVRPAGWRDLPTAGGVALQGGEFDVNLWAHWADGHLRRLEGEAAVRQLSVRSLRSQHIFAVDRFATILRWEQGKEGWRLDLDELYLERAGHAWERSRARLEGGREGQRLLLSYADLGDVADAVALGEWLAPEVRERLRAMRIQGAARALRAERTAATFALQADVDSLSSAAAGALPGLQGLGGRLRLDQDGGELQLAGAGLLLEAPRIFGAPLLFDRVDGSVQLRRRGAGGWLAEAPQLTLANRDIGLRLGLRLRLPAGQAPLLDLRGAFERADATAIRNYLPVGIMAPSAVSWLNGAFRAGSAEGGAFAVLGPLDRFPFAGGEGQFVVQFNARGVELAYHPEWPRFEAVDGDLRFAGRGLAVRVTQARVFDWRLAEVAIDIPDLSRAVLTARGGGEGSAAGALRFLRESALSERLDGVLSQLAADGPAGVSLELRLPLGARTAEPLRIDGEVRLRGNALTVAERLPLRELSGRLHFSDSGLDAEGVEGVLFGGEVSLAVDNDAGATRIRARGAAQAQTAARALQVPLLDRVHGPLPWQATYRVPQRAADAGTELAVSADLSGAAIDLPAPVAGAKHLQLALTLGGKRHGALQVGLDERLALAAELRNGTLARAALQLGGASARLPEEPQIYVGGFAEGIDLGAWFALLREGGGGGGGRRLPPVVIEMERLHLVAPSEAGEGGGEDDPSRLRALPPLHIDIARFGYGAREFGRLLLASTWASPERLQVRDFLLVGPQMRITGAGEWQARAGSRFELRGSSQNLGATLEALGYGGVMRGGKAEIAGELRWPGTPLAVGYEDVAGQLHLNIEDGAIQRVDPGAGRLLGLLSLQALPSRLLLDFSDVFGTGYPFASIEGDVRFETGNGFTDNLLVRSATSEVLITGRTGFVDRDFDQLITVVPNVSGSLPVAGGLAWGPQVGAVLLVLQKLFFSNLDEAAAFQYRVTGSWEEPQVVRLERSAVEGAR